MSNEKMSVCGKFFPAKRHYFGTVAVNGKVDVFIDFSGSVSNKYTGY